MADRAPVERARELVGESSELMERILKLKEHL
jgi:hypothetical protein